MSDKALREQLIRVLDWKEAHVGFDDAVGDLASDKRGTRAPGFDHSVWELVEHMRIAQEDILDFCVNPKYVHTMKWPDDYWPRHPAPPNAAAWDDALASRMDPRFLMAGDRKQALLLADALRNLAEKIRPCQQCFNLTEGDRCSICRDPKRDPSVICVVEYPRDLAQLAPGSLGLVGGPGFGQGRGQQAQRLDPIVRVADRQGPDRRVAPARPQGHHGDPSIGRIDSLQFGEQRRSLGLDPLELISIGPRPLEPFPGGEARRDDDQHGDGAWRNVSCPYRAGPRILGVIQHVTTVPAGR